MTTRPISLPPHEGYCDHCGAVFHFELVHSGFNESGYAYCDACGRTALLDTGFEPPPGIPRHRAIEAEGESLLTPCACGGSFRSGSGPRCPSCRGVLSAEVAADYIESAIRPVAAGWSWQRNWNGLYCLVIEKRVVSNPWKRAEQQKP